LGDNVRQEIRLRVERTMAQKRNGLYFLKMEQGFWKKGFTAMTTEVLQVFARAHPDLQLKQIQSYATK
jgi:hypothetical protein